MTIIIDFVTQSRVSLPAVRQARWVSTRGDTGFWGELVSATVVK